MNCEYFYKKYCQSCNLLHLGEDKSAQLKYESIVNLFAPHSVEDIAYLKHADNSRNKAKLVVLPQSDSYLKLGFIDTDKQMKPLIQCPLYEGPIKEIATFIENKAQEFDLIPYNIEEKRGEFKALIIYYDRITDSSLIRFIMRSKESLERVKKLSHLLTKKFKQKLVISFNLQPKHAAILEGEEELILSENDLLTIKLNNTDVFINVKSFFQTNTLIAHELYQYTKGILDEINAKRVLDLFCGIGAFSFATYDKQREYLGVEISKEAILAANKTKDKHAFSQLQFIADDINNVKIEILKNYETMIVNPPRRGLGDWVKTLRELSPQWIIYSSCNPESQMKDIQKLENYEIKRVKPFDMFALTSHVENLVLLKRIRGCL